MNTLLLNQAIALYRSLDEMLWKAAISRDVNRWQRLERISGKALKRWARRQDRLEALNDRQNSQSY